MTNRQADGLVPLLVGILGAGAGVFVVGGNEVLAAAIFIAAAGVAMLLGRPTVRPGWLPIVLGILLCLSMLVAFLPQAWFPVPAWRSALAEGGIGLADSVSPQPWLGWFWWLALAATALLAFFYLSVPVKGQRLAIFLHAVALIAGIYAALAIFAYQTGWKYPFSGGAIFGFFPNKNHTATLLFVGSIISFGLLQWELAAGNKASAALAALCGAPPLAALLFFSNSRAGVLFLVLGFVVWASGAPQGNARRTALLAVAILAIFLTGLFAVGGSEVRNRLSRLWQDSVAVEAEGKGDVDFRQPIFRDTVWMLKDAPVTGAGLAQFEFVFPQYRKDSLRAAKAFHPESDWLLVAAEGGLPSMIVLLALAGWYFVRSWRGRNGTDGLLRWTAASAVGAAIAHGIIDVPWHRVALGWFLLVVAMGAVPSSGVALRRAGVVRAFFVLIGSGLLAAGVFLAWEQRQGRVPAYFQWEEFSKKLEELGKNRANAEGEQLSLEAVKLFPMKHEPYYWLGGFLRNFEGTDADIEAAFAKARLVEPVLPQTAVGQAVLWKGINLPQEIKAWGEAVRRGVKLDEHEGNANLPSASSLVQQALASVRGRPDAQRVLLDEIGGSPVLTACWVRSADAGAVSAWAQGLGDPVGYLDSLPEDLRGVVLEKWISLPDPSAAVSYMEARSVAAPGIYWRQLSKWYAAKGDKPGAVALVAAANGVALDGPAPNGELWHQLSDLRGQGNDVAVRRLVKEAASAKVADADKLTAAMVWAARDGDWDMAWQAASRLATMRKNGQ